MFSLKSIAKKTLSCVGLLAPIQDWRAKQKEALSQKEMLGFYSSIIRPGDLCFDVGANIGSRTEIFRKLDASVVAIEPQSQCVAILKQKFINDDRVHIVPKGLAGAPGVATMAISTKTPVVSTLSPEFKQKWRFSSTVSWDKQEQVELTTLDELIKIHGRPTFCKVDVEGFEEQVFKGLSTPVPFISYEFNIEFLDRAQACLERLRAIGYSEFNYCNGETMMFAGAWLNSSELMKCLNASKDPLFWGDIYARSHR